MPKLNVPSEYQKVPCKKNWIGKAEEERNLLNSTKVIGSIVIEHHYHHNKSIFFI